MSYTPTARDYYAAQLPVSEIPDWFKHSSPVNPPSKPVFPGLLNAAEQLEVEAWFASKDYSALTLPNAIAFVDAYIVYLALNDAWIASNALARIAQYRLALADAHISNYDTVPTSLSVVQQPVSAPPSATVRGQSTAGGFAAFTDTYDRTQSGKEKIPTNATSLTMSIWGGGGGGGDGYGGASGGYSTRTVAIAAGDWGLPITFAVGTGGAGDDVTGGNGVDTSISSFTIVAGTFALAAVKGTGGSSGGGGTPGTASGGTTNTTGNAGTTTLGGAAPNGGTGNGYGLGGTSPGAGGGPGSSVTTDDGGNGAPGRVTFAWS